MYLSGDVFSKFDLSEELGRREQDVRRAIDDLDADHLLNTPTEDLVAAILADHGVKPPELLWDEAEQLPTQEVTMKVSRDPFFSHERIGTVEVPGSLITVVVPVKGDVSLLGGRASTSLMRSWDEVTIYDGELRVSTKMRSPEPTNVKAWFDHEKGEVGREAGYIASDVARWARQLPSTVQTLIDARKSRLLKDRGIEGALGLKVRLRSARPHPVPVRRKRVATPRARKASPEPTFQPEPELEQATYVDILDIICSFARGMERSPRVAQRFNEEELRDQFLMHLNGHFEGDAGGELFNGAGKTDILIRQNDRNVFIGECKFWEGAAKFDRAVDQLGSYLVWRDTKAAMIVFIRQRDPSAVVTKARIALAEHSMFKRPGQQSPDLDSYTNHVLKHADDDQREIQLALIPVVIRQIARPRD